jgi:hypothetical protein
VNESKCKAETDLLLEDHYILVRTLHFEIS